MSTEPLEIPQNRQLILPIWDNEIYEFYKKAQSLFWTDEELHVDLSKDKEAFKKLDKNIQVLVKHIIAFFAIGDIIVNETIQNRFLNRIQSRELKLWYNMQMVIEDVHSIVYAQIVEEYIPLEERDVMFHVLENFPTIKKKIEWYNKWMNDTLAQQIFVNIIMEGLFFSGAFCVIFWIGHQFKTLPGLTKANEPISRDEGLHTELALFIYNKRIQNKLSEDKAYQIMKEALDIEEETMNVALPHPLPGMNINLMRQYLQYVADFLLSRMEYKKIFNVKNPFKFMEKQSVSVRITDFFHDTVSEYSLQSANTNDKDNMLDFSYDF